MNKIFKEQSFEDLLKVLNKYDENVQQHYKEFQETNKIWNKIKHNIAKI